MVMDDVFERLRKLQDVLAEKISLEKEILEIPKMLITQEELLARLKKSFIEKNTEYEETQKNLSSLKAQLAEAESTREKAEKNMDSISTQREYEALDKEIRDASEREQQLRKDLQKEERTFAELNEQQKRDAALIQSQEEELNAKKASVEADLKVRNKQLEDVIATEKDIIPGLDEELLFKFDRIIRSKLGLGIVSIKGGVCTGCHMILPAEFANKVRNGEDIVFCPYCSRILFFEENEGNEPDFFDEDTAGSLADLDDLDLDDEDEFDDDDSDDDNGDKRDINFDD